LSLLYGFAVACATPSILAPIRDGPMATVCRKREHGQAHIHGVVQAQNECPGPGAAGTDGLIDTLDGLPAYGPIMVTFSTEGDTSAGAGFDLGTAPEADANGNLFYQREIKIKGNVAANLNDLHIVIHGEDLNDSGMYDGLESTLGMGIPLEAELPVACGTID